MANPKTDNSTVMDGLKNVFQSIAGLTMLPDSAQHLQFLTSLMGGIQKYVTQQGMAATQSGKPPAPMPGQPGGPTPPGGGQMVAPPNAGNINPDEIRRLIGSPGGGVAG